MDKLILTDVDDTVLKFAEPFQDWVESQGIKTHGRLRDIYSVERMLGDRGHDAIPLMRQFVEAVDGQLPPEPCALEVLPELHKDGWSFVAITACGVDDWFHRQRVKNLEDVFGFHFDAVHCVELRDGKEKFLHRYRPTIWVEDNWHHAVVGSDLGHDSYVLTRGYNAEKHHPQVRRVATWHQIREELWDKR